MSEDYTYQPIQTTAQMQARIRDLEAQLNAAIVGKGELEQIATIDDERRAKLWATAKHWQERAEDAERENTELRAKLDAVPVDDITFLWRFAPRNAASLRVCGKVGDWLSTVRKAAQP
jgi:Holliday junction resolvase-like predicted endonuclease